MCLLTVLTPKNTGVIWQEAMLVQGNEGVGKVTRVPDLECCQSSHGRFQC